MKLSKTQETLMNEAKAKIDLARKEGVFEYLKKTHGVTRFDNFPCGAVDESFIREYENALKGIVEFWYGCKHETLRKLESLGLIEIVNIEYNQFKVLNY